jgi:hypothetical protein
MLMPRRQITRTAAVSQPSNPKHETTYSKQKVLDWFYFAILKPVAAKSDLSEPGQELSEAAARLLLERLRETGRPAGNCVLLTGNWKVRVR